MCRKQSTEANVPSPSDTKVQHLSELFFLISQGASKPPLAVPGPFRCIIVITNDRYYPEDRNRKSVKLKPRRKRRKKLDVDTVEETRGRGRLFEVSGSGETAQCPGSKRQRTDCGGAVIPSSHIDRRTDEQTNRLRLPISKRLRDDLA